jgi:hypothetical protein
LSDTLYPKLTDEELAIAGENLGLYLELAWEIMEEEKDRTTSDES